MIGTWKPLTKTEYIIWRAEAREQVKNEFPGYDDEELERYLNAIEDIVKGKIERNGGKFTDF